jgi:catechol 2,3-dioxygenase-like lactoylglutathione lyase family enzyme
MDTEAVAQIKPPVGFPFQIRKIGHVVLHVKDIAAATKFYAGVLGFRVSDVYGDDMMPGGAVFMRLGSDHHGLALFQATRGSIPGAGMNHMAFEVGTLDEVIQARNHLRGMNVDIDFEGRRRAGVQIAVEFRDPDGHRLEIYWGIDQVGSEGHVRPPHEWKGAQSIAAAIADPVVGQDTSLRDPSILNG